MSAVKRGVFYSVSILQGDIHATSTPVALIRNHSFKRKPQTKSFRKSGTPEPQYSLRS